MPPVRELHVLPGQLVCAPPGPAAAVLVDAQVRDRGGGIVQHLVRGLRERAVRDGQEIPACRAASAGVIPRSATSAAACSRSRRVIAQRGGTCGTHSVNVFRGHAASAHFIRRLTRQKSTS